MKILKSKDVRTVVILCGGRGTRLGAVTKKTPKSLVMIKDKPIIWYILKILKKNKFNHFILPIGYKGRSIKKYLDNKIFSDYDLKIVPTGINTPIAKRIFNIKKYIKSENFLLLNGDAIFDFNLSKIIKNHIKSNLHLSLMTCKVISPFGVIIIKDNKPINFKRDMIYDALNINNSMYKGAIFTGMALINKEIFKSINYKSFSNFEVSFYPKILKKKKSSYSQINGFWYAMDNPKDINVANKLEKKNEISKYISKLKNKFFND